MTYKRLILAIGSTVKDAAAGNPGTHKVRNAALPPSLSRGPTMSPWLPQNAETSAILLSAGIKDIYHPAWLCQISFFSLCVCQNPKNICLPPECRD